MATPNKLKQIEQEEGVPLVEIIPALVNDVGQKEAAVQLKVSAATISLWLKEHGYVARTVWEQRERAS